MSTRFLILGLILMTILPGIIHGETYLVAKTVPRDFKTINKALMKVVDGDEILIGPGVWQEETMTLTLDLMIRGLEGPDSVILDGEGVRRLFHVTLGAQVKISDLSLENGLEHSGSAIHVDEGASARLVNCTLTDNVATYTGGAGFVRHPGSSLVFENCSFFDNYAPRNAGAVGVSIRSYCGFFHCWFEGNRSEDMAGAVANFDDALMEIRDCVFRYNSGGDGGAIRIYSAPAIIENNTFYSHKSGFGTVYIYSTSLATFNNNIVVGEQSGYGLYAVEGIVEGCNIFFDNDNGPTSSPTMAISDQVIDPLFCDPGAGVFDLCADSPALDGLMGCGGAGARGQGCEGCGPVATERFTWGTTKSLYR